MTKPGYVIDRDVRGLTAREREVLSLAVLGLTQQEIAGRMEISKQRVGQIVGSLVKKGVAERGIDSDGRDQTMVRVEVSL